MGILERKEREKEEMRRRIVDAAQHLYVQNGFEKLSIRAIADEIEYSPATIYLYYKDKSEVLHAIHQQAFGKLMNDFRPIVAITDPFDKLVAMVQECIHAGLFKQQDAEVAAMMIWSTIHGHTALFIRKRLNMFPDERRAELMEQAFTLFCDTIKKSL